MRTNRTPEFSFNDSLKPYNRRQKPATQSQNGNYAWTAIRAGLVAFSGSSLKPASISASNNTTLEFLLFGSDAPVISFISGLNSTTPTNQAALVGNFSALATWMQDMRTWALAVNAAVPALPGVPIVPPFASFGDVARLAGTASLFRPAALLGPGWDQVQTDLGAGCMVRATGGTGPTAKVVKGFPQTVLGQELIFGETAQIDDVQLTVLYEGAVIHGQNASEASGGNLNPQPAYVPCILPREQYTQAIFDAGNVLEAGGNRFIVMGLWQNYAEGP